MKVILNVGLSNNPLFGWQVADLLKAIFPGTEIREGEGEYLDKQEPTIVAQFDTSKIEEVDRKLTILCELLTQECIARMIVKDNGEEEGRLVFNPFYRGQMYEFNNDYFIRF